jgi:polysaccharide export outer membrane protein
MKAVFRYVMCGLTWCALAQQGFVAAQEQRPREVVGTSGQTAATTAGAADGKRSPALTGALRRPLYRLRKSDVLDVSFTFAPEFNQTASVQPDGFIALKGLSAIFAESMTVVELQDAVRHGYAETMHDPEVTIVLRDFDKPYFIAGGQVTHPGKYELRADTTVVEAVEIAGGFSELAKHSQVVLFRRVSDELSEARLLNVKHMLQARNLGEDLHLQPGDFVFVPQNSISKIRRYLPTSNLSMYSTPTQF